VIAPVRAGGLFNVADLLPMLDFYAMLYGIR